MLVVQLKHDWDFWSEDVDEFEASLEKSFELYEGHTVGHTNTLVYFIKLDTELAQIKEILDHVLSADVVKDWFALEFERTMGTIEEPYMTPKQLSEYIQEHNCSPPKRQALASWFHEQTYFYPDQQRPRARALLLDCGTSQSICDDWVDAKTRNVTKILSRDVHIIDRGRSTVIMVFGDSRPATDIFNCLDNKAAFRDSQLSFAQVFELTGDGVFKNEKFSPVKNSVDKAQREHSSTVLWRGSNLGDRSKKTFKRVVKKRKLFKRP